MRRLIFSYLALTALIFSTSLLPTHSQLLLGVQKSVGGGAAGGATYDPAAHGVHAILTNGNLTIANDTTLQFGVARGTTSHSTGKYYAEFHIDVIGSSNISNGVMNASEVFTNFLGHAGNNSVGYTNGVVLINGGSPGGTYATFTTNDTIGMATDATGRLNYWSKNCTWQNSADPAAGTGGVDISAITGALFIASDAEDASQSTMNASGSGYACTPPTGYGVTPW